MMMRQTTAYIFRRWVVPAGCAAVAIWTASIASSMTPSRADSSAQVPQTDGIVLPPGYRDWRVISIARVGGVVNDLRVKLGNDVAIKAFRGGKTWFPDGTIIARLAYRAVASPEDNAVIAAAAARQGLPPAQVSKLLAESVVAGPALNVQIMVKDSKRYTSTGGWGFAQFTNGKRDGQVVVKNCFSCHEPAKDRDFVFTRYSP
jgi:hypothetical protein